MNSQNPVAVKQVILHINSHLDEFLAFLLLHTYGEQSFPGILTAVVRYAEADIIGSDSEYDRDGILPIGCGKGRFAKPATPLVAKHLGITDKPELKRILREAYTSDTQGQASATQLSELIKFANRVHSNNVDNVVLKFAWKAIDAITYQERYHFAKAPGEKSLLEIFRKQVDEGYYQQNPKVRQTMFNYIHESMRERYNSVTELSHIVECLWRKGYRAEDVENLVEFALCAIEADQLAFQEQVEAVNKIKPLRVWVQQNGHGEECKLLVINSDSLQAQKAARYIGAEIILLRKSSGNCQIFVNKRIQGIHLANAIRMIRWLELDTEAKESVDWPTLGAEGTLDKVPNWYYFKRGEIIFNGSETHKLPASEISTQALIEVLQSAFHYKGVLDWCNKRRIQMNPEKAPGAKASSQSSNE